MKIDITKFLFDTNSSIPVNNLLVWWNWKPIEKKADKKAVKK